MRTTFRRLRCFSAVSLIVALVATAAADEPRARSDQWCWQKAGEILELNKKHDALLEKYADADFWTLEACIAFGAENILGTARLLDFSAEHTVCTLSARGCVVACRLMRRSAEQLRESNYWFNQSCR